MGAGHTINLELDIQKRQGKKKKKLDLDLETMTVYILFHAYNDRMSRVGKLFSLYVVILWINVIFKVLYCFIT